MYEPTIAEAEAIVEKTAASPETLPLSKLLAWVRGHDPEFSGYSDPQIFFAAYGDRENAQAAYTRACNTDGQDECVRRFCIERQRKMVRTLAESATLKPA